MTTLTPVRAGNALREELSNARTQTDQLFELLASGSLYERPVTERHRLIFYLGHFEAFDWNLLARRGLGTPSFNRVFDQLFERGIDPPPGKAPTDTAEDWPIQDEVAAYGAQTRAWIDEHLDEMDPWLLQMAIEHRQMHAETFAYLMHGLPYYQKRVVPDAAPPANGLPERAVLNPLVSVAGGKVTLGKSHESFGWDNEHLAVGISVPPFKMSRFKISNGEYLKFVRDGGPKPHFWFQEGERWLFHGMFSQRPLPLDWPVWVTWDQAAAYAEWRSLALPSEAQFQLASGLRVPDPETNNFDYQRWDPIPVDAGSDDRPVPFQMVGNGWEWTRDVFAPFEGFEPHPHYAGYSADFFDGRHYVMKGASPRTARILTRPSFRNWFRPDYPHMYAGFRLVDKSE